ncbi:MAG: Uma2 family endonuclease [Bacteroidota bacterium]
MTATNFPPRIARQLLIEQIDWTSEQYQKMISVGILTEDDRVELLLGKITEMSPIGKAHAACIRILNDYVYERLYGQYSFSFENPILLPNNSEPEPDFALLTYREDRYASGHPTAVDVLLVIEVADHTLEKDRVVKSAIYADAGIAEYWIINLVDRCIEVHTEPLAADLKYGTCEVYEEKEALTHSVFGAVEVASLLPY